MVVGAAGDEREAALDERRGERPGVRDDLVRVRLELGGRRLLAARPRCRRSCGCAGRPAGRGTRRGRSPSACSALHMSMPPRGPRSVLCVVVVTTSATGDRRRVRAAGDEAGDVRDVGARGPRRPRCAISRERGEVDRARERGAAARTAASAAPCARARGPRRSRCGACPCARRTARRGSTLPVIETFQPCVRWPPAGSARPITVSPGLQEREVDGEVRGRARVRLHVRVLGAEQRLRAVDAELLDLVDVLLALVVALARVALGVLVREHRAGRREHGARDVVLRRDQADRVALAALLGGDQLGDLGVDGGEGGVQGRVHAESYITDRPATRPRAIRPYESTPFGKTYVLAGWRRSGGMGITPAHVHAVARGVRRGRRARAT